MSKIIPISLLFVLAACTNETSIEDTKEQHIRKVRSCAVIASEFRYLENEKAIYKAQLKARQATTRNEEQFQELEVEIAQKLKQQKDCESYVKKHGDSLR